MTSLPFKQPSIVRAATINRPVSTFAWPHAWTHTHTHHQQVNVSTDPSRTVDISAGDSVIVDYTYSVKWRETTTPFDKRMDKYSRYSFLPQHLEVGGAAVCVCHAVVCSGHAAHPVRARPLILWC